MNPRITGAAFDPGQDGGRLLEDLDAIVGVLVGGNGVVCALLESADRLRFSRDLRQGQPRLRRLAEHPAIATSLAAHRPIPLPAEEARYFGAEKALAVPSADCSDAESGALGACVLLGVGEGEVDPGALEQAGRTIGIAFRLLRQRDALAERSRDMERAASAFRSLVETTGDAVCLVDLDGHMRMWNAGCEEMFGFVASQAVGKVLPHVPRADRSREIGALRLAAGAGCGSEANVMATRKDGSRLGVSVTRLPLSDAEGLPSGVMMTMRPISVGASHPMDPPPIDLMPVVFQRLKDSLTAMLGFTQMLAQPEQSADASRRQRAIRALESHVVHFGAAIDDLRLACSIEQGLPGFAPEPSDLAALLREETECFGRTTESGTPSILLETETLRAAVDPDLLRQAMRKLMEQAADGAPEGRPIQVGLREEDGCCILSVSTRADGPAIGIDSPSFFEPTKEALSHDVGNDALGVHIAHSIAAAHGGSLWVSSSGSGTILVMRLPLAPGEAREGVDVPDVASSDLPAAG